MSPRAASVGDRVARLGGHPPHEPVRARVDDRLDPDRARSARVTPSATRPARASSSSARTCGRSFWSWAHPQDQPLDRVDVDDLAAAVAEQHRRGLDLAHHRRRRPRRRAAGSGRRGRRAARSAARRCRTRRTGPNSGSSMRRGSRPARPGGAFFWTTNPACSGSVIDARRAWSQASAISSGVSMLRHTWARSGRSRRCSAVALSTTSQPSASAAADGRLERVDRAGLPAARCRRPPAARSALAVVEVVAVGVLRSGSR